MPQPASSTRVGLQRSARATSAAITARRPQTTMVVSSPGGDRRAALTLQAAPRPYSEPGPAGTTRRGPRVRSSDRSAGLSAARARPRAAAIRERRASRSGGRSGRSGGVDALRVERRHRGRQLVGPAPPRSSRSRPRGWSRIARPLRAITGRPAACASTAAMPNSSSGVHHESPSSSPSSSATRAPLRKPAKRIVGPARRRRRRRVGAVAHHERQAAGARRRAPPGRSACASISLRQHHVGVAHSSDGGKRWGYRRIDDPRLAPEVGLTRRRGSRSS